MNILTFVAGHRVVEVAIASSSTVEHLHLRVTVDERAWSFVQPGWRPLCFGSSAGLPYLWSAREIIVLPEDAGGEPEQIAVDEDLLYVFRVDGDWLAVCETSIRRLDGVVQVECIQLGEVVETARLADGRLSVVDMSGTTLHLDIRDGGLALS